MLGEGGDGVPAVVPTSLRVVTKDGRGDWIFRPAVRDETSSLKGTGNQRGVAEKGNQSGRGDWI